MVKKWIREALGIEDLHQALREERSATKELIGQFAVVSQTQAQAVNGMIAVLDRIYKSYETDGTPPEERHINEEMEDAILTKSFYGSDESDDGA